jgi:hypothetical protein
LSRLRKSSDAMWGYHHQVEQAEVLLVSLFTQLALVARRYLLSTQMHHRPSYVIPGPSRWPRDV